MTTAMLPKEFYELERFAEEWCLATENDRYAKRLASSMDDMQAFYDALAPRAEEAIAYCDRFPLHDLPDDARNLLHLVLSLLTVSFAVELWRQPRIPDTGAAMLECVAQPVL